MSGARRWRVDTETSILPPLNVAHEARRDLLGRDVMRSVWMKRRIVFAAGLFLALGACATSGAGGGTSRGSSTRLTEADIASDQSLDLYTIIQRRRPQWLQVRGGVTTSGPVTIAVILDGQRQQGGLDYLRSIRGSDVEEVRYMNARDATTRYGTNMTGGAIVVVTKH